MSVELTIETVTETVVLEVQDHVPAIVTIDTIPELREELDDKVDKVSGYSLVDDDEIAKLLTVEQDAQKNTVNSVAGKQGDVLLDKTDVGLGAVDNTADADKPVSTAVADALAGKVDKVTGKVLSTHDLTDPLYDKLVGLEGTHWRGTFVSVAALEAGVTDPVAGDYADVDSSGEDAQRYIWDANDNKWVAPITAAQVKQLYESNPDTNAFTDDDGVKLSGIAIEATKNRDDSENADKVHTHAISDVTGLVTRLSDTDTLIRRYILSTPFTPYHLFIDKEKGFWADPSDTFSLFQNAEGTIPVTANGDPIGLVLDKTGNNYDLKQTVSASRPKLLNGGIVFDRVDDALTLTVPVGGITGTLFLATTRGTASYGVSMPAGVWTLGNAYNPLGNVVSAVLVDRALTVEEKSRLQVFGIGKGGTEFGVETSFYSAYRVLAYLVDFPLIDTSRGTNFSNTWNGCTGLTSFPALDVSRGTIFQAAWYGCTGLTSFPMLNVSSGINFNLTWYGCTGLTSFPANFFDNCLATNLTNAFLGTKLSQSSIDGILVSINSNATSNGTFTQSGGSAPSVVGQAAIDAMRARGWTVTTTGGY